MPPKIQKKLQDMKREAEHTMLAPFTAVPERYQALGTAIACSLLLAGHTPEAVIQAANHQIFIGAGDRPAMLQTANFFKDLI